jgi:hypothetical protein
VAVVGEGSGACARSPLATNLKLESVEVRFAGSLTRWKTSSSSSRRPYSPRMRQSMSFDGVGLAEAELPPSAILTLEVACESAAKKALLDDDAAASAFFETMRDKAAALISRGSRGAELETVRPLKGWPTDASARPDSSDCTERRQSLSCCCWSAKWRSSRRHGSTGQRPLRKRRRHGCGRRSRLSIL